MKTKNALNKKEIINKICTITFSVIAVLLGACSGYNIDYSLVTEGIQEVNQQATVRVSAYELHQILTSHFGYIRIKLSDSTYILPANQQVRQLSAHARYNMYGASDEIRAGWDCDDYAIAAMAPLRNYAFGAMYITTTEGYRHVINVFVNDRKKVVYWEPQTCSYYQGQFYAPELIIF